MADTNYIGCIVKVLETPKQKVIKNNILTTKFRVQLPQTRNKSTTIATVNVWGNLARDVSDYYKMTDYIMIEGYLSLSKKKKLKKVEITVLKVYPFFLTLNNTNKKV